MQGFANGCSIRETLNPQGLKQFGDSSKDGVVFDASQYAFFGKDVLEEVELGGLEGDGEELPAVEYNEEEFLYVKEELINNVSGLNGIGVIGDRGSRENKVHLLQNGHKSTLIVLTNNFSILIALMKASNGLLSHFVLLASQSQSLCIELVPTPSISNNHHNSNSRIFPVNLFW